MESRDQSLVKMKYDIGDGKKTFWAYVTPNVSSFYQQDPPASRKVNPMYGGQAAKFINLSNKPISVYWEPRQGDFDVGKAVEIRSLPPFSAKGTSTFPTHSFVYATTDDGMAVKRFVVKHVDNTADDAEENLYPYDPYHDPSDPKITKETVARELSQQDQEMYWTWRKTLLFDKEYRKVTGRTYLATYLRPPPIHFMWPADYFHQQHWVTTRESHFISSPGDMARTTVNLKRYQEEEPIALETYRDHTPYLNMSLKVLSCAPRVFEIENFLSPVEVEHIIEIGALATMGKSTLGDESSEASKKRNVRTSKNTWVPRHQSAIIDSIYRRAADLMRINEALLRPRAKDEELKIRSQPSANRSIAEELQLVHYSVGQEYQAHHDFAYSPLSDETDSARFATLLLYLNEDMVGGETSFPRFVNAHTFLDLKVKPGRGKAILFYSQLPDGNFDDFSQHAAKRVLSGEKWLINLWVSNSFHDETFNTVSMAS